MITVTTAVDSAIAAAVRTTAVLTASAPQLPSSNSSARFCTSPDPPVRPPGLLQRSAHLPPEFRFVAGVLGGQPGRPEQAQHPPLLGADEAALQQPVDHRFPDTAADFEQERRTRRGRCGRRC
nr:hypothetical protein [Saccharopolyspora hirsuta]